MGFERLVNSSQELVILGLAPPHPPYTQLSASPRQSGAPCGLAHARSADAPRAESHLSGPHIKPVFCSRESTVSQPILKILLSDSLSSLASCVHAGLLTLAPFAEEELKPQNSINEEPSAT